MGRPKSDNPKVAVSIRLDPEVLAAWKATGPQWQSRVNEALRVILKPAPPVEARSAETGDRLEATTHRTAPVGAFKVRIAPEPAPKPKLDTSAVAVHPSLRAK